MGCMAAVSEQLDCSPPTKTNRVQSPGVTLLDFRKWKWCLTMPLVGGFFSGDPPFPLHFHSGAGPYSPRFTLIGSEDPANIFAYRLFTEKVGWTPVGTLRPRSRSEEAIRATLTRTPSASSLLRARRAVFPSKLRPPQDGTVATRTRVWRMGTTASRSGVHDPALVLCRNLTAPTNTARHDPKRNYDTFQCDYLNLQHREYVMARASRSRLVQGIPRSTRAAHHARNAAIVLGWCATDLGCGRFWVRIPRKRTVINIGRNVLDVPAAIQLSRYTPVGPERLLTDYHCRPIYIFYFLFKTTEANRVRFPAESLPDFLMWESCWTMALVGGFFAEISRFPHPFIPALLHTHLTSLSSALESSMLGASQISLLYCETVDRDVETLSLDRFVQVTADDVVALQEPTKCAIAGQHNSRTVATYFLLIHTISSIGAAVGQRLELSPPTEVNRIRFPAKPRPDEAAGRWVFIGKLLPPPPPVHPSAATFSPRFTLIGSQDLDVKSTSKHLLSTPFALNTYIRVST
ncbi:hypothetical protein PR048_029036 [Dryococelus australis]|uniref:Uncharacterized protein n=1 Tax=Dryococelus australis TaxID=614101 RepID=A0ABQ9GC89_9NEOP|nr:hypothetical protein PR048_029036 [Dryococelus australis]